MKIGMVASEGRQPAGMKGNMQGPHEGCAARLPAFAMPQLLPANARPNWWQYLWAVHDQPCHHAPMLVCLPQLTRQRVDAGLVVQRLSLTGDGVLVITILQDATGRQAGGKGGCHSRHAGRAAVLCMGRPKQDADGTQLYIRACTIERNQSTLVSQFAHTTALCKGIPTCALMASICGFNF